MTDVAELIRDDLPRLTALRHEIHQHPELAFEERETARRIEAHLAECNGLDIQTHVAGTGVVALLNADKPGPCVALRCELDALPIAEQTDVPYKSKHEGRMHACGHDGHMACLVGAARVLARIADQLPGKVKFVFQPAEEGGGGGRKMIEAGLLNDPPVDAVFALHGWPLMKLGTMGVNGGPALASTNPLRMTVHGVGAHAAYPHKGVDPIVAASHIVVALQTIASRSTNPLQSVVVTIGQFQGGSAENIIPDRVELVGTIRTLDPSVRKRTIQLVKQIAESTAAAFGARAEVRIDDGYPVLMNDDRAAEFACTARSPGDSSINRAAFAVRSIHSECVPKRVWHRRLGGAGHRRDACATAF